ncbi:class I lanthipeptide [Aquimarina sp. U1-2]|uniref:class I lanthipeptide n=1 Tax=Aquimarina sp. U1-2 TaxID=2823141 RepID=UPI001AED0601|nr:class I lanthipeptide [Aquimarina sp. U1-2]MBP2833393.1 class I lanthipeptide [Aquimarina sp. U1-2]
MKTQKKKKLSLEKLTIASLSDKESSKVVGGRSEIISLPPDRPSSLASFLIMCYQ